MKEKHFFTTTVFTTIVAFLVCGLVNSRAIGDDPSSAKDEAVKESYKPKTKVELRKTLTPIQYEVTQNEGTEPAFRNKYWNNKKEGVYYCLCCDLPLFGSDTKYKSGTGWPSFWGPMDKESVAFRKDFKLFYTRVEVHCKRCGAHLGHVFDDGPRPTGKRYCMNSASLKFLDRDATKQKELQQGTSTKKDETEKP